ncbi:uncharacterized protein LOC123307528 [Coccinella septempunctata]|uniref:uncharacterized protein LOC123307528 n=1 Tax=Coccinella septempunctata TaxID=41139 RepID=UPI001D067FA8|nr:uncharacterized protein LOC123307528 [Coccinella septempunctata]XP_044745811.1 uncharacterized protein LOC123307528 [Coccinella septempunctata]
MTSFSSCGLTEEEIEKLRISHKEISKDPKAMQKLFYEYFKQYPHNQKFFPFRDVPLEGLFDDTEFKRQCALASAYMNACIENLEDYDVVEKILLNLGKNHRKYRIPSESFWESRDVIVEGISELVDEETHKIHEKYWDFIFGTVLRGMGN